MQKIRIWNDRTFDFTLPLDLFPALLERVKGTPARLEEKVKDVPAELLKKQVGGSWSLKQHAAHLAVVDILHTMRLDDFLGDGEALMQPQEIPNAMAYVAKYNAMDIDDILSTFRRKREAFVERMLEFTDEQLQITKLHQRLNVPMRIIDNAIFCVEHDDHHMALMSDVRKALGI